MSRETENLFKAFHQYLDENSDENRTEEDVERLMNEFMTQYNSRIPEPITEEKAETSDDYLELAQNAADDKEALKHAKKALKLDPDNYDAKIAVLDLKHSDDTKMVREYEKAVYEATNHMKEEGYFDIDSIGVFWGILETRPYMRLRVRYIQELIQCGMIWRAKEECEEMLRLCEGDNVGMRYHLMHIYTYFEDEEAALALHRKYGSHNETEFLLPLSILYYKKGDFTKSTQYLRKLHKVNKDLKKFLKIILGYDEKFEGFDMYGGYRPGTIEELMVEVRDNQFLFIGMDAYMEWAMGQAKKL